MSKSQTAFASAKNWHKMLILKFKGTYIIEFSCFLVVRPFDLNSMCKHGYNSIKMNTCIKFIGLIA